MRTSQRIAQADVINLGSTFAWYDFDYGRVPVQGVNLACRPQYLDMDLKFVNKYKRYFKNGVKVAIVLPNFVFAGDAPAMSRKNDIYYFKFAPRELEWFTAPRFAAAFVRLGARKAKQLVKKLLYRLWGRAEREKTPAEKEAASLALADVWHRVLGIPSMRDGRVPPPIQARLRENVARLDELIANIKRAGGEPYIVVPPASEIMNRIVSKECMQAYLFDPIAQRKDKSVPVLDYLYAPAYQPQALYRDGYCLNREGAFRFTADVCARMGLLNMGEANEPE